MSECTCAKTALSVRDSDCNLILVFARQPNLIERIDTEILKSRHVDVYSFNWKKVKLQRQCYYWQYI